MLLAKLQQAETKADVRELLEEHGYEPVNAAWGQLDDLQGVVVDRKSI